MPVPEDPNFSMTVTLKNVRITHGDNEIILTREEAKLLYASLAYYAVGMKITKEMGVGSTAVRKVMNTAAEELRLTIKDTSNI